jgi:ParB family chromosome partitioning protein
MTGPTHLEQLDPRNLTEHPRNARTDLGDLTGLIASITAQGVIEPLTVAPTADGGHIVIAGHRRRAAAIAAGRDTVPCVVRRDLQAVDDEHLVEQLGAMLSENVHRQNLDAVEEGRAVQQLIDFGLTPAAIATRTGLSRKHVAKAAGVALLDGGTAAAVSQAGLDLAQAAVVAAYRDDPAVAADLVEAAAQGPGAFTHRVTRAKQDRERRAEFLAKEEELRAAGRTLVETAEWNGTANRRVVSLAPASGEGRLSAAEHANCPGSAVRLTESPYEGVMATEVCTDFRAHGHVDPFTPTSGRTPVAELPPEQREEAKVERRQLIEDNKAMAAANTTRRQWIRTALLERRRDTNGALRYAVEALHTHRDELRGWFDWSPTEDKAAIAAQLGLTRPGAKATTTLTSGDVVPDARLPIQLLGHVAGAIEQTIAKDSHRAATGTVRTEYSADYAAQHLTRIASWLRFLVEQGYALAPIEQRIVDAAARRDPA